MTTFQEKYEKHVHPHPDETRLPLDWETQHNHAI